MLLAEMWLTSMLETQSAVKLVIREPDTPGGLRLSMAWRPVSKSVTAAAAMTLAVLCYVVFGGTIDSNYARQAAEKGVAQTQL